MRGMAACPLVWSTEPSVPSFDPVGASVRKVCAPQDGSYLPSVHKWTNGEKAWAWLLATALLAR